MGNFGLSEGLFQNKLKLVKRYKPEDQEEERKGRDVHPARWLYLAGWMALITRLLSLALSRLNLKGDKAVMRSSHSACLNPKLVLLASFRERAREGRYPGGQGVRAA